MSTVVRSLKDPIATNLLRLSFDKKLRYAWRKCILSSPTLISELSEKFEFEDIILDKKPKGELPYRYKNLQIVSPKILERVGQLKNSTAGILATLTIPQPLSVEIFDAKRMVVLDGIGDAGELGTILRSVCAFGWKTVWITHTCADPFEPACIRASQGVLFTLPYRVGSINNAIKHCRQSKGITKLKMTGGQRGQVRIGMRGVALSESSLPQSSSADVCLLIQGSHTDSSPGTTDFKSVEMADVLDVTAMPMSVLASSLLYAVQQRYSSIS